LFLLFSASGSLIPQQVSLGGNRREAKGKDKVKAEVEVKS
jgi:hypothetical protein